MRAHILVHVTSPPTADCEALEYALAMAAFDLPVRILFTGDGRYWLRSGQSARRAGAKSPEKLLAALPVYGIDDVAYSNPDTALSSSGVDSDKASSITPDQASEWVRSSHHTVTF